MWVNQSDIEMGLRANLNHTVTPKYKFTGSLAINLQLSKAFIQQLSMILT